MTRIALLCLLAILPAFAQQPKFVLADVHSSSTPFWFAQNNGGMLRDGIYFNRDATVLNLIQAAYGLTEDEVSGGPNWLKSDLFDVVAKVPDGTTPAAAKLMLQSLLAERFGLALNKETRPTQRYVMTVAKSGHKLKAAEASKDAGGCRPQMTAGPVAVDPSNPATIPNLKAVCRNVTMKQFIATLQQMAGSYNNTYLAKEVVDSTNLEGVWDFDLEFTTIGMLGAKGKDGITLFDAVNKQLGLKLDLQDVPVTTMVVASVNRNPTPNSPEVATGLAIAAPRFEVASVKPLDPKGPRMTGMRYNGGSEVHISGSLSTLISQAFFVQPNAAGDVIIGLPKSADSQFWDITAKLPTSGEGAPVTAGTRAQPPSQNIVREMLKGLLVDQFGMKIHRENREVTVYALTVIPGKRKLVKADGTERSDCRPDANAPKPFPNLGTMVNCKNITMAEFARNLEQATGFFDHPIVDTTGLTGGWNFMIGWSLRRAPQMPNPNQPPGAATDASDPTDMSSYDAVEKELGLKLVKQKRSIPVFVIDHITEAPVE